MTDATFDLDDAALQPTAEMTLLHPKGGAPLPAVFTLASPEHPAREAKRFGLMRRRRAQLERDGKVMRDPTEDAQDETDMLVASTLDWKGLSKGGKPYEFSAQAAFELYSDPKWAWVREQVTKALDQRELFIGSSATV